MGELGPNQPLDKAALEERVKAASYPKRSLGFFVAQD